MSDRFRLPMFPLGVVVFPLTMIPLRVFEPRYQRLLDTALASDQRFGTVLIERGLEVGGGDMRFDAGTLVEVLAVQELEEGHRAIAVAGIERIEVVEWLPDDPHPWAMVRLWPDDESDDSVRIGEALLRLERVLALASELGADVAEIDLDVSDDPAAASHQLSALAPIQAIDRLGLLRARDPARRVDRLIELLEDQAEVIRAQLG